ncbi:MAG: hypothetical protein U0572_05300 [Phycisphaerales bacterium]
MNGTLNTDNVTAAAAARSFLRSPMWLVACFLVVAAAIAFRAWILFHTPIPPGVDAGYYPYQSRTLIEQGRLAYDDAPLRFAIDAVIAKLVTFVSGASIDDSTLLVSRLVDAVCQPFVALAVFLVGWSWSRGAPRAILGVSACALLAIASRPILDMVGDFEKQSLALVWSAFAWLATWRALSASTRTDALARGSVAACFYALTASTHVGTAGGAAIGGGAMLVAWALLGGTTLRRFVVVALALLAVLLAAALVAKVWAPGKVNDVLNAPAKIWAEWNRANSGASRGPGPPMAPLGPRGPGAPSRWFVVTPILLVVFGSVSFVIVRRVRRRAALEPNAKAASLADGAFALGMLLTAITLLSPLFPGQYGERVGLMAFTPCAFVATFLFAYCANVSPETSRWRHLRTTLASVAALALMAGTIASTFGARPLHMPEVVTAEGIEELRTWRKELALDFRSVVAARHGLEWWVGYAMNTAVRMGRLEAKDFDRYESLYMLVEHRSRDERASGPPDGAFGDLPMGPPPGSRDHRGPERRPRPPRSEAREPGDARPLRSPPERPFPPPADMPRDGGFRGGGGPMRLGSLPNGAILIRQGRHFSLYEIPKSCRAEIERDAESPSASGSAP